MQTLHPTLITHLLPNPTRTLYLAYSGGVDSHVLLHLACQLPALRDKLVAVYVDHGLQAQSEAWGAHCQRQCQALGVAFQRLTVNAAAKPGESPEAAARQARYQALSALLQSDDVLLLAQHREDQMETLLLQLFRGAGVQGLAAMPCIAVCGRGLMLRPLLETSKQTVLAYARQQDLQWVDDPSNQSSDFDRNFLRNEVVPLLKQRWPGLDKAVARSARHCALAQTVLQEYSHHGLAELIDAERSLDVTATLALSDTKQALVVRQWLALFGLQPPSELQLHHIIGQVMRAKADANPLLRLQQHSIRRYRQRLYCLDDLHLVADESVHAWTDWHRPLKLHNGFSLSCRLAANGIERSLWENAEITVSGRQGGELLSLPGRNGHHTLKKLYQERGEPPWRRTTRPLIYLDDRLAAVGELWIADWAWSADSGYRLAWSMTQETS